jgi:hypothetical protein
MVEDFSHLKVGKRVCLPGPFSESKNKTEHTIVALPDENLSVFSLVVIDDPQKKLTGCVCSSKNTNTSKHDHINPCGGLEEWLKLAYPNNNFVLKNSAKKLSRFWVGHVCCLDKK